MRKVYVVGGHWEIENMFKSFGWEVIASYNEADIFCFTGGEDVSPELYGEEPHPTTYSNPKRDDEEISFCHYASENNIPMVGICRGGQFLNVMNAGRLWQHVSGHAIRGTHGARRIDVDDNITYLVTSTHHQMMRPHESGKVLLEATFTDKMETVGESAYHRGVEAVWYEQTKCLCFQPHPEFSHAGATKQLFFDLINEYVFE